MKSLNTFSVFSLLSLIDLVFSSTPAVTVKGNAFFVGNNRFYLRGVDYQPGGESANLDPLSNINGCKRDIEYFKKLSINTIRVYHVDNSANHDDCMKMLSDAGIYVVIDVNTPKKSLNRENPYTIYRSYNEVYLQSVFATIDAFAKYDNTLLFFSGNEVISKTETFAAPYIKAVGRDMKKYIKSMKYRAIPVGYSATDIPENRFEVAAYLNCGPEDVRSDFISFNDYSFCGHGIFKGSDWEGKVGNWTKYSIPLFLSEYGCKEVKPRTFNEVPILYSADMRPVYSGGLIYQYSEEPGNEGFGIVSISGDSAKETADFSTLEKEFKDTPLNQIQGDGGYKPSLPPSNCPAASANWKVNGSLPVIPQKANAFFGQGAGSGKGNNDVTYPNGSQWAGTPSEGWADVGDSPSSSSTNGTGKPGAKSAAGSTIVPTLMMGLVFGVLLLCGL